MDYTGKDVWLLILQSRYVALREVTMNSSFVIVAVNMRGLKMKSVDIDDKA